MLTNEQIIAEIATLAKLTPLATETALNLIRERLDDIGHRRVSHGISTGLLRLRSFGTFHLRFNQPKTTVRPQTGLTYVTPAHFTVSFRYGYHLIDIANGIVPTP